MTAVEIDQKQFEALIRSEKPVLVDFWAPWCGYCRRIGPAYDKIAEAYSEDAVIAKVNVDEVPQLAAAEQIEVIPTLVLYRSGKAVDSIVAPESKVRIERFLQESLTR